CSSNDYQWWSKDQKDFERVTPKESGVQTTRRGGPSAAPRALNLWFKLNQHVLTPSLYPWRIFL
ncbi:MAG TPA: hypothetical protein VIR01_09830, partial [Pyrinomonadaceae bacterium]